MRTMLMVCGSIVLFAGAATGAPERVLPVWTSVGAGCVPAETSIQGNRYVTQGGSVFLRDTPSGMATFYCPITKLGRPAIVFDPRGNPMVSYVQSCPNDEYLLRLTYTDADGRGSGVNVSAELLLRAISDGTFAGTGARVDSSNSATTTPTSQAVAFTFPLSVEQDFFYLYVRVDLTRATGNTFLAQFHGVSLECPPR